MIDFARVIKDWVARRKAKAAARKIEAEERARRAIVNAKQVRRQKHMASRYLDGDLRAATCRGLAASCGRDWVR